MAAPTIPIKRRNNKRAKPDQTALHFLIVIRSETKDILNVIGFVAFARKLEAFVRPSPTELKLLKECKLYERKRGELAESFSFPLAAKVEQSCFLQ